MNPAAVLASALSFAIGIGAIERFSAAKARRAVPIRIHVNGTRGKSTVTRLIRSALAEGGIPCLGKTTGTAARYILPDGSEKPVRRLARPSIREQCSALVLGKKLGVRALVAECMAIKPELQWVSENKILLSTIGVITNARIDHVEEMGGSLEEITRSLGNTVPKKGILFTSDPLVAGILEPRAMERQTKLVLVRALDPETIKGRPGFGRIDAEAPRWWLENAGIALAVAEFCGVERDIALRGIAKAKPDPGAARFVEPWEGIRALDASAANDPESLLELVRTMVGYDKKLLFVYNNRQDRLPRLLTFLAAGLPGKLIVTGANPGLLLWRKAGRREDGDGPGPASTDGEGDTIRFVPSPRLVLELKSIVRPDPEGPGKAPALVLCGNTKGWPVDLYGGR